ncbi:MAG: hypothetical protein QOE77_1254 [Blastocatellia bacterium]|nr:hypothetical protein [Blastocatellia bacterium]
MPGKHLEDFLAQRPSQKLCDRLGANLFELYYFQLLQVEGLHADPHWGNYLFTNDGSIGLVDFGCVKYLRPGTASYLRSIYLYPGDRNSRDFRRLLEEHHQLLGSKLTPATTRALIDFSENFYRMVYPPEPDKQEQVFDFADPAFLHNYLRESKNLFRTKGVLSEYIFMCRAEVGLYQTLHRLRLECPRARLSGSICDAAGKQAKSLNSIRLRTEVEAPLPRGV